MKNSYIYYLEQMRVRAIKTWRRLLLELSKYLMKNSYIYYLEQMRVRAIKIWRRLLLELSKYPMKNIYIYYLEPMRVRAMKVWRWLPIKWKKYISLVLVIGIFICLAIHFLRDEIVSGDLIYTNDLELIKKLYSEDPLKLVLPFSISATAVSLWSVFWRVWDKAEEFKNAEFSQNELRFSNAVNLLSKKDDPIFPSEGIRELARLKRENKIDPKRIDQLTISKIRIESGQFFNADLRRIDLSDASLNGADLRYANLEDADFTIANLENADLEHANLENTNFTKANLKDTDLRNANLENADFTKANLKTQN